MKTIWKYALETVGTQESMMPTGAQVLSVGLQHGKICVWVLIDDERPVQMVQFAIVGTGNHCWCSTWPFIGTVQQPPFVWHVFMRRG